jgi:hypothetical protein
MITVTMTINVSIASARSASGKLPAKSGRQRAKQ